MQEFLKINGVSFIRVTDIEFFAFSVENKRTTI